MGPAVPPWVLGAGGSWRWAVLCVHPVGTAGVMCGEPNARTDSPHPPPGASRLFLVHGHHQWNENFPLYTQFFTLMLTFMVFDKKDTVVT